jgi:MFS family permease
MRRHADDRIFTARFLILWLVGFTSYASVYLLVPVLPLYLQERGATTAIIGILLGMMSFAALFTRPFSGWLSDSWGRRPLIAIGLAGLLVFPIGVVFVSGAILFALLRLLSGVGWGCLTSNANTLAGEMAPLHRRGEAIGLYTMAGSTAFALSPVLGLAVVRAAGYHAAFGVSAALTALALGLSLALPRPTARPLAPLNLSNLVVTAALGPAAVVVTHAMIYGGVITFLPLLVTARGLGDPGLFFTIYAVALIGLRGVAGHLSDRFGRPAIIGPGLLFGAAAMLLLAVASSRWQVLAAAPLVSLGMAFVQPASLAWALDLGGDRRGAAMATMVAAQDMGVALGGSVLGIAGTLGGYGALFTVGAALSLTGGLGLLILVRVRRRGGAPAAETASGAH